MSDRSSKVSKHDSEAVVSHGFEPDKEIKVWALDEKGALDFFGLSTYDKVVRVIKNKPETEREKEKYSTSAKLFGISQRVREPSNDERVVLSELLRDAALLLREARPVMEDNNQENWEDCYLDFMHRLRKATEK